MKLGLSDLIVVLIIMGIILFVFRGMPATRKAAPSARVRRPTAAEIEEERFKSNRRSRLRILGGVFVIIGLFVLGSTFKVFDYLFMISAGAALVILAGVAVLFLSFRR